MDTRKITIERGEFNVREGGRKDGIPVVMLHGWPESSYCWEGVAQHLNPDFRIIAPDLRGLGDSERTMKLEAYQKLELAKDVRGIADALDIGEFFLVGHDWGGIVAQELALLAPGRVKKLVLLNIAVLTNPRGTLAARQKIINESGGVPFWYQYFQRMPHLPEAMIKGNENVWVRFFFGLSDIAPKIIDEYVRCYRIENTPATAASYYRSFYLDEARWAGLAAEKFPMPGLYIHGKRDSVIIPEFVNHIEDGFESVEVASLDAAHFVQEEKPEEVAGLLNNFL